MDRHLLLVVDVVAVAVVVVVVVVVFSELTTPEGNSNTYTAINNVTSRPKS